MTLYEIILSNDPHKWQNAIHLIGDAEDLFETYRNTNSPEIIFELTINSLCIASYYVYIDPVKYYLHHKKHYEFALIKLAPFVLSPGQQLTPVQQAIFFPLAKQLANFYCYCGDWYYGQTSNAASKFEIAAEYFRNASTLYALSDAFDQLKITKYNYAAMLYNQARMLLQNSEFEKALSLFKNASNLFVEQNTNAYRSRCEYFTGYCLTALERHIEAISHFENAIPLYEEDRLLERQAEKLKQIAEKSAAELNFELAKRYVHLAKRTLIHQKAIHTFWQSQLNVTDLQPTNSCQFKRF